MTAVFNELSSDKQARFEEKCKQFGIDPETIPGMISTQKMRRGAICGHPGGNTVFPPANVLTVSSVQELKTLGGCSDQEYSEGHASDAFITYPKPLMALAAPTLQSCDGDVCQLKAHMTLEHHAAVAQDMNAYMMGNSTKVTDYVEHINALYFPMQMAVHAARDLVITKDKPLIVNNPSGAPTTLIFGTVTVEPGGYILAQTVLNLCTQVFTVMPDIPDKGVA